MTRVLTLSALGLCVLLGLGLCYFGAMAIYTTPNVDGMRDPADRVLAEGLLDNAFALAGRYMLGFGIAFTLVSLVGLVAASRWPKPAGSAPVASPEAPA